MGKTSENTDCKPRFLRFVGALSAWRNSRYELVCNSIKFGGAMISLILPKLIRSSVTRDGMVTFTACQAYRAGPTVSLELHKARTVRSTAIPPTCVPRTQSRPRFIVDLLIWNSKELEAKAGRRHIGAAPNSHRLLDFHLRARL